MTGEVSYIRPDGTDSNGDCWSTHAYVARQLRRPLRPFDKYIGPYIACKEGRLWLGDDGSGPYVCLWPQGIAPAYADPIVRHCEDYSDLAALDAAREVLRKYWEAADALDAEANAAKAALAKVQS